MALKDWRKLTNSINIIGGAIHYSRKDNKEYITIFPPAKGVSLKYKYFYLVLNDKGQEFSSKREALKFAKQYMRTH